MHLRVEAPGAGSHHLSLAAFGIPVAEEHRTAEVGRFDGVEIDDEKMPDAHQGEILDDFVPERAGAHHHHLGVADFVLFPPGNEFEGSHSIRLQVGNVQRFFRAGG